MKLWNGRFRKPLHPGALKFSSSLSVDRRLAAEDIEGSLAHVAMLAETGILTRAESAKISLALKQIGKDIASGKIDPERTATTGGRFVAEDIHMFIEHELIRRIGPAGGKLHTARSRNDQIALDERIYLNSTLGRTLRALRALQKELVTLADRHRDVVIPGMTHLQRAQPVLFAHHLLAYVGMLDRDRERFADCLTRVRQSPLGAAALGGTPFPIDRMSVAKRLGFDGIVENSIDSVADRDVLIESVSCAAIAMMHLSRLAEELVLWSSSEWNFIEIGDAFTTGSSIMPQKKNPDMAELIRGKSGRVYGDLVALLTMMKGLPLAYNRDMQEDKEPLFDAFDTLLGSLEVCAPMMRSVRVNVKRFEPEMEGELLATELADYLVRKGLPFRGAHEVTGRIVSLCHRRGVSLNKLPLKAYRAHSKLFDADLFKVLDVKASIARKKSAGSTSPKEVRAAIGRWKKKLS